MKLFAKLFTVAALAVGISHAHAEGGAKQAVLDTGKGGTRLTVSVPDFADGPYDFAKNPGIGKAADAVWNHQEVMFNGASGESSVIVYLATLERIDPTKTKKRFTTEYLAQGTIQKVGFEGRAEQINCPPQRIEGAKAACYKMSGDPIFDGKPLGPKYSIILAVISFANDTQGYTLMSKSVEKNVAKFSANPDDTVRESKGAFVELWKGHKAILN